MAELKTKPTEINIEDFLATVHDEAKRKDSFAIHQLMQEVSGDQGQMWGGAIAGYGHYHYKYESGRENDWFQIGFSPRKQNISLYFMGGFSQFTTLLHQLGKHKTSKGCLYINKLADVDVAVLKQLMQESIKALLENKQ